MNRRDRCNPRCQVRTNGGNPPMHSRTAMRESHDSRGPCVSDTSICRDCYNLKGWACSTAVSAGDSSKKVPSRGNTRSGRDEFRGTFEPHACMRAHGNPEPSRRGIVGRCRDYLRARSALNNRQEHPAPTRTKCAGEEIVHSRRKRRGKVNPLVVGSNPTGPSFQEDPGRFMTFRKNVIFVVVDESARVLALVDAP